MALPGRILEIQARALISLPRLLVDLEGDAKGSRRFEAAVRVELIVEGLGLAALDQLLGTIRAQGDDRETEVGQLLLGLAQLAELRAAVGSPASSVEDEEGTAIRDQLREIHWLAVDRADLGARSEGADGKGLDGLRVGKYTISIGGRRTRIGETMADFADDRDDGEGGTQQG